MNLKSRLQKLELSATKGSLTIIVIRQSQTKEDALQEWVINNPHTQLGELIVFVNKGLGEEKCLS